MRPTIKKEDIEITPFRGSGKGGQNRNKVETAIRIKYIPLGIAAESQSHRTQEMNKKEAYKLLAEKINKHYKDIETKRKQGARLERIQESKPIRTYNVKDNRVTDRRLNKNFALDRVLDGDLDSMMRELKTRHEFSDVRDYN